MQHPSQRLNELQMLDHALDCYRRLTRHRGNWAATEIRLLEQSAVTGESAWAYIPPDVECEMHELAQTVAAFREAGVL